jgi:hypothetical protein
VQNTASRPKITVSADESGIVSQAGALLLTETARITGLQGGLSAGVGRWRRSRAVHDPGKIVTDLAVAVALGGDCLADAAVLRAEPALFGLVASDPVVSRLVTRLAGDAPAALKAIRSARAAARQQAWQLAGDDAPGSGGDLIPVDIDATIVTSHSEKEQAAPTWKKTYGFHPLAVFADHGAEGQGEPLATAFDPAGNLYRAFDPIGTGISFGQARIEAGYGTFSPPAGVTRLVRFTGAGVTTYNGTKHTLTSFFVHSKELATSTGTRAGTLQAFPTDLSGGGTVFSVNFQP